MSGGITYVLDLRDERVNAELVDVEAVPGADADWLREVVRRHTEETGSQIGQALLSDWPMALSRFRRIMPRDYRRALEAQERAVAEGRDPIEAVMEAARG